MRSRNIKPGFFKNEYLAYCSPLARLLFAGLWCMADRDGRMEDRPKRIKVEILPFDECDIDALLEELVTYDFIVRYLAGVRKFIEIKNFQKHQKPHHKEPKMGFPGPEVLSPERSGQSPENSGQVRVEPGPVREEASCQSASSAMIPDSLNLIPDSLNHAGKEKDGDGSGQQAQPVNRVGYFNAGMVDIKLHPIAKSLIDLYQRETLTVHSPSGARNAVLEILSRGDATEQQLTQAVKRFGKHVRETYQDRQMRMSAWSFFGGERPAWPDWIDGSPVVANAVTIGEEAKRYRKKIDSFLEP